jgi:hypothetical protein
VVVVARSPVAACRCEHRDVTRAATSAAVYVPAAPFLIVVLHDVVAAVVSERVVPAVAALHPRRCVVGVDVLLPHKGSADGARQPRLLARLRVLQRSAAAVPAPGLQDHGRHPHLQLHRASCLHPSLCPLASLLLSIPIAVPSLRARVCTRRCCLHAQVSNVSAIIISGATGRASPCSRLCALL